MHINVDIDISGEKEEVIEAYQVIFGAQYDDKALEDCINAIKREKEGNVRE